MGKTVRGSTRELIYQVYKQCLAECVAKKILSDRDNVYQRTADMTGISVSTVRRIALEGAQNGGVFITPGKHKTGRPKKDMDDFNSCAIRQKVQFFYTVKKEVPTLRKLLTIVRQDLGYTGGREHLRKMLKNIGFKFKKCQSDRTALMEKTSIAAKREEYLKMIMQNRNLPKELRKDIIYLGECYIHQTYKLKKCWQSIDMSRVKHDVTKGKKYISMHAGGENGFLPNTLLIFCETNKNGVYCSEMNKTNFTKWVKEKLIPNLPPASIVVMDNAPYHSVVLNKAPTSATKVTEIKQWLIQNNIPFDETLRKPQLLGIVKRHKPEPRFEIDELLGLHGHSVLRLPPYHNDLNPMELIWEIIKDKIAAHNVGDTDVKEAAEHAFRDISVHDWRSSCQKVMRIARGYYERGLRLYDEMDRLVANQQDETSSSSESEDDFVESTSQNMDEDFSEEEYLDEDFLS